MNFSIHIDEELALELSRVVKRSGKSRNALVNEALRQYLEGQNKSRWPQSVMSIAGTDKKGTPFESFRKELGKPKEDPFA